MKNATLSQRIHKELTEIISAAECGDRLPSEPKLAEHLGVSRASLREVMRTFETRGLIRRKQGAGTFVIRPSDVIESGLEVLESIPSLAERIGYSVTIGKLKVVNREATKKEARKLELETPKEVVEVSRVILTERRPIAFLVDVLSEDNLSPDSITEDFNGSVLDILTHRSDTTLTTSRCEINSVTASSDIAGALDIQPGNVLLRFEALLYEAAGNAVDYSISYFLPGFFRFHVVRRIGKSV